MNWQMPARRVIGPVAYLASLIAVLGHPATFDADYNSLEESTSLLLAVGFFGGLLGWVVWLGWMAKRNFGQYSLHDLFFAVSGTFGMLALIAGWSCAERHAGEPEIFGFTGCEDEALLGVVALVVASVGWGVGESAGAANRSETVADVLGYEVPRRRTTAGVAVLLGLGLFILQQSLPEDMDGGWLVMFLVGWWMVVSTVAFALVSFAPESQRARAVTTAGTIFVIFGVVALVMTGLVLATVDGLNSPGTMRGIFAGTAALFLAILAGLRVDGWLQP